MLGWRCLWSKTGLLRSPQELDGHLVKVDRVMCANSNRVYVLSWCVSRLQCNGDGITYAVAVVSKLVWIKCGWEAVREAGRCARTSHSMHFHNDGGECFRAVVVEASRFGMFWYWNDGYSLET